MRSECEKSHQQCVIFLLVEIVGKTNPCGVVVVKGRKVVAVVRLYRLVVDGHKVVD